MDNHTGAGGGTTSNGPPLHPPFCALPTCPPCEGWEQPSRTGLGPPEPEGPHSTDLDERSAEASQAAVADGTFHLWPEHSARPAWGYGRRSAAARTRQLEGPRARKGLLLLGSTVTSGGSKTGHHPQPSDRAPCVAWSLAGLSACLLRKDEAAEAQELHCPPNLGLDLNSKEHFVSRGRTPLC